MSENFPVTIEERKRGKVAILQINGIAPNNTLSKPLLDEFVAALYGAAKKADGVLVTSGNEKFFSNGLDGKTLLASDAKTRRETIEEMIRVFGKLVAMPKPWIVEIAGHAMAGGAVISTAADNRYMLKTGGRIGFSELAVGLSLPAVYMHGMRRIVDPRHVRGMIEGGAYKAEEALAMGFVDGVAEDREKLRAMCMKRFDALLRLESNAYALTRSGYQRSLLREIAADEDEDVRLACDLVTTDVFEAALNNIAGKNRG